MRAKEQNQEPQSEPSVGAVIGTPPLTHGKTKTSLLLELISSEGGATLHELTSATGWLPHTARAAITGLRRRGHDVERQQVDGVSRYMLGSGGK